MYEQFNERCAVIERSLVERNNIMEDIARLKQRSIFLDNSLRNKK